jgi:hypothetical protein
VQNLNLKSTTSAGGVVVDFRARVNSNIIITQSIEVFDNNLGYLASITGIITVTASNTLSFEYQQQAPSTAPWQAGVGTCLSLFRIA